MQTPNAMISVLASLLHPVSCPKGRMTSLAKFAHTAAVSVSSTCLSSLLREPNSVDAPREDIISSAETPMSGYDRGTRCYYLDPTFSLRLRIFNGVLLS